MNESHTIEMSRRRYPLVPTDRLSAVGSNDLLAGFSLPIAPVYLQALLFEERRVFANSLVCLATPELYGEKPESLFVAIV
jgi:hypothetical protein